MPSTHHWPSNSMPFDPTSVSPDISLNNKRAKRLLNKDLLAEFRWCRDYAFVLGVFALALHEVADETPIRVAEAPTRPKTKDQGSRKGAQKVGRLGCP